MLLKNTNKLLKHNGLLLNSSSPEPPTLPPYTLRLKFKEGVTPTFYIGELVLVDAVNNIWDYTYEGTNWVGLLNDNNDLLEVIDGNTTGVTNMSNMFENCYSLTSVCMLDTTVCTDIGAMFRDCYSLTSVPLFDTSSVTGMSFMFYNCGNLTYIPLFNTTNVRNMDCMFNNCVKVESGALALYTQASTQANIPDHTDTFTNCGIFTETGVAELAQIPSDWGGTVA